MISDKRIKAINDSFDALNRTIVKCLKICHKNRSPIRTIRVSGKNNGEPKFVRVRYFVKL